MLYKLEQNYRSTGTILNAANALIANNAGRIGKKLWTSGEEGERVRSTPRSTSATRPISSSTASANGSTAAARAARSRCCTAPTRSRAFSKRRFLNARMPYRVYGGLRFFERAEIKDALAYLRLVASRADDASFERIVNLPTRGIGAKTLDTLRDLARATGTSLWHASTAGRARRPAAARGAGPAELPALIERLGREVAGLALHEQVDHVIR